MQHIISRPMTARVEGDFVVFLIGMRINRWWKVNQWMRVAAAMPRMIRELEARPELGLLGYQQWLGRTSIMVQYWRSLDQLMAYAHARDAEHLPAWREFNRRSRSSDAVGIWHETFVVPASNYECIYYDMPRFGLARATETVEARGHRRSAAGRLGRQPQEQGEQRAA